MANSCYSMLTFWGNEKVLEQLKIWKQQLNAASSSNENSDAKSAVRTVFYSDVPANEDLDLGSKWVFQDEVSLSPDDDQMSFQSAWSRPEQFEKHLAKLLYKLDKKIVIRNNFHTEDGTIGVAYTAPYDEDGAYSQEASVPGGFGVSEDEEVEANEELLEAEREIIEFFVDDMPKTKSVLKKHLPKGKIDWKSL